MNNEVFQQALENISEPMIEEAAQVYDRAGLKRRKTRNILRIAAIAAVLALLLTALLWPTEENYVTGPGMLSVHAHEVDANGNATIESEVLEEGVKFTPNVHYDPTISYQQHFPISFSVDEELYAGMDITLDISTNAGIFYKNEPFNSSHLNLSPAEQLIINNYGQHFTVDIEKKLYWKPNGFDYEFLYNECRKGNPDLNSVLKPHYFTVNPSYIDVIICANDLIVGYIVIEITETNGIVGWSARNFSFEVLEIVSFPQVDGYWQNVTLKYVQEQINRIHSER